ncbi:MAG: hypothetical protein WBE18_00680, partial [Gammaproteobacteria bacterium]
LEYSLRSKKKDSQKHFCESFYDEMKGIKWSVGTSLPQSVASLPTRPYHLAPKPLNLAEDQVV